MNLKRILIGLMGLMGLMAHAQGPLQFVDTTTTTRIPISNSGWLSVSNPAGGWLYVNYYYTTTNPAFLNIGDYFSVAFGKLNGDVQYLSTAVRTNGNTGSGQIPMSSTTAAGGYVWVPVPTGGGSGSGGGADTNLSNISGAATNVITGIVTAIGSPFIGDNNGRGTNTAFFGVTTLANATSGAGVYPNVFIYAALTNLIPWMGAANQPFGLVTASTPYPLHNIWDMFHGTSSGYACDNNTGVITVQYQFPTPVTAASFAGAISSGGLDCTLTLQDSPDGTTWTTIATRPNLGLAPCQFSSTTNVVINFSGAITAAYWKWTITTTETGAYGWFGAQNWGLYPPNPQAFVSSYMYNDGSHDVTDDTLVMDAISGVAINMNYAGGYALNVNGGINCTGGFYSNGVPVGGAGVGAYTNTTANAGVVNGGLGIGTNLPTPYWAMTAGLATNAMVATNDPFGNPLASLQAATSIAQGIFSGAISNWYGVGSNLTVYASATNVTVLALTTNGNIIHETYQTIWSITMLSYDTTSLILVGGGDTRSTYDPNQAYNWNSSLQEYVNTANSVWVGYQSTPPISGWQIYGPGGALYTNLVSPASFPYAWGNYYDPYSPPTGFYPHMLITLYSITNTYDTIGTLGAPPDRNANLALNAVGKINATGYEQNGIPLQTVLQGMMYPYLWVTNCAGNATNLQGVFVNTWLGYYTNATYGTLLIPAGYYGAALSTNSYTTNFSTSISLLCSNLPALDAGGSFYGNATNVLGYYTQLQFGHDLMPTNAPLVSPYTPPPPGVTTNLTGTFNGATHTAHFTNGLLMNFQ